MMHSSTAGRVKGALSLQRPLCILDSEEVCLPAWLTAVSKVSACRVSTDSKEAAA